MRALSVSAIVAAVVGLLVVPPIAQDPTYHRMADERTMIGIPNALNVLSNLPFAVVGALGLQATFGRRDAFRTSWERLPAAALFGGVALTAAGSSYYHLSPTNERLVWDRLPMTIGFAGLLTLVLADRLSTRAARAAFGPLLAIGIGSVVYWYRTELAGAGDLRPYALVQFGSLLGVVVLLVAGRPGRHEVKYIVFGLGAYMGAKALELADARIYAAGAVVSGHTLKHLVAAGGVASLVAMLRPRKMSPRQPSPAVRVHLGCL